MSDSLDRFLEVIDVFCKASGLEEKTLSWRMFNDSGRIELIRAGGDLGTRKRDKALQWMATRWPADAVWPEGVERPMGQVSTVSA